MLLFLYGEDNYRLKQKLKAIKKKYLEVSNIDANFSILNTKADKDFGRIIQDIETVPFLAEKRLVVLENFLAKSSKKIQESLKDYIAKIPETSIVIFVEEGMPGQRTGLFKALKKKCDKFWQFDLLHGYQLERWIGDTVNKFGGKVEKSAVQKLASYVGSDLWQMKNEIEKLILFKKTESKDQRLAITSDDVELLVKAKLNTNIFNLIDALGYKNIKKATQLLEELLESGENEIYILTMIIYQFRNILIVKDLLEQKNSQSQIAKKTRIHPYVLGKSINQAKNFTLDYLNRIYQELADTDLAIKTGKTEPHIALDLLLVKLVK
jgi:DNA polymerase III subunit delta